MIFNERHESLHKKYKNLKKESSQMADLKRENEVLKEELRNSQALMEALDKDSCNKLNTLSSLNQMEIRWAKRNDIPILNLDHMHVKNDDMSDNSLDAKIQVAMNESICFKSEGELLDFQDEVNFDSISRDQSIIKQESKRDDDISAR